MIRHEIESNEFERALIGTRVNAALAPSNLVGGAFTGRTHVSMVRSARSHDLDRVVGVFDRPDLELVRFPDRCLSSWTSTALLSLVDGPERC